MTDIEFIKGLYGLWCDEGGPGISDYWYEKGPEGNENDKYWEIINRVVRLLESVSQCSLAIDRAEDWFREAMRNRYPREGEVKAMNTLLELAKTGLTTNPAVAGK